MNSDELKEAVRAPVDMALGKVHDLGNFIRDQRRNARLSLRKLSNMAGVSNPYLSQIERGMRRPSAEILQAIAKALRISAETLYVKAGILEERDDSTDPVTSLLRDLTISDKQKQVLIEIYQSFRHENDLQTTGGTVSSSTTARKVAALREGRVATPKRTARAKTKPKAKPAARAKSTKTKAKSGKKKKKK
ncbi:MAG TPA: helix-turn-helix transcriptional regulator [Actinomycetota bacterium]|nr:helix-turn-helix transcriptional regulator [Actinomycetota bacterium]